MTNTKQLTPDTLQAISRAIADPSRFGILQQIARSECIMCSELEAQGCLTPPTISHHLKELQEAGLIQSEREGRKMRLTLRRQIWNAYLQHLQRL